MQPTRKKNNDVYVLDLNPTDNERLLGLYRHLQTVADVGLEYTDTGDRILTAEVGSYCLAVSRLPNGKALVQGFNGNSKEFECLETALLRVIDMIDHFCM